MTTAEEMIEKVAAILMGRVNAPEVEIYAAARAACAVAVEMCARVIVDEKQRIDTYIFEHDKTNRITESDVRALSASRVLEKVGANIVGLATAIKGE